MVRRSGPEISVPWQREKRGWWLGRWMVGLAINRELVQTFVIGGG